MCQERRRHQGCDDDRSTRSDTYNSGYVSIEEDMDKPCDNDNDDILNDEMPICDACLLKDISIFEYFQPYHNTESDEKVIE